jgi:hypothetical protein
MNTQRQLRSLIASILICAVSVAIPWCPAGAKSIPFDSNGIPIVITGADGQNVA